MPTPPNLAAHPGDIERHGARILDLDLDLNFVHRVLDDALAEAFAGGFGGTFTNQRLEQPVHRRL